MLMLSIATAQTGCCYDMEDLVVSTVTSQKEGTGFDPWVGPRVPLTGFSLFTLVSSHNPNPCMYRSSGDSVV